MIVLGLFITRVADGSALVKWDIAAVTDIVSTRTDSLSSFSSFWSRSADAPTVIAIAFCVVIVLAILRQWRDLIWLAVALGFELLVFLSISYLVDRRRPDVVHLGSVPGTGSFPSGHVGVTIVLWGTVALILARHGAPVVLQTMAWLWTAAAAACVGWARVYRGMHQPIDVACGLVYGTAVLLLCLWAFRPQRSHGFPPFSRGGALRTSCFDAGNVLRPVNGASPLQLKEIRS